MQNIKKIGWLVIFFLLFSPVHALPEDAAGNQGAIYFYNPETNIDNFALLKKEFDTYLARYGDYHFTPFSKAELFEQAVAETKGGLFFVSSWHFKTLVKTNRLDAMLVAVVGGAATHKKVLTAKQDVATIDALRGGRVASSASKEYTLEVLGTMLGTKNSEVATSMRVLSVPKDIDALMSVAFGMAESALTTHESLEQLATLNPTQRKRLLVLATSDALLRPIISVAGAQFDQTKALLGVFERMGTDPQGEEQLRMLGLDGFRPLAAADKQRLEP